MLKTAAKNRQVELKRPLTDEDLLELLAKQVKQRQESVEQFQTAGRTDWADKEAAEIVVLEGYLPPRLSREEMIKAIDSAVVHSGAAGPKDMGKVMQMVMAEFKGRVDGKTLSGLVKERLSAGQE